MDRLAAMQTFVRVVESGSFSAVAREIRSTQSAVSKRLQEMESDLPFIIDMEKEMEKEKGR